MMVSAWSLAGQEDWSTFTHKEGKFHISTPYKLVCGPNNIDFDSTMLIKGQTCVYQEEVVDKNRAQKGNIYMVSYVDYPEDFIPADSLALIQEFLIASIPSRIGGHVTKVNYTSEIRLHQYYGLLYRVSFYDDHITQKGKLFWVKNRLYSVQITTRQPDSIHLDVDRFLNSFGLME
jgi:hypothetical protein